MTAFTLNGKPVTAKSEADTPLLWVIRDELKLIKNVLGGGPRGMSTEPPSASWYPRD